MPPRVPPPRHWRWPALLAAAVLLGPGQGGPGTVAATTETARPASDAAGGAGAAAVAQAVLQRECVSCHGGEKQRAGLDVSSREALLRGGESGVVVIPGRPEESLLLRVLAPGAEPHMPPKGQLSEAEISGIQRWIAEGLPWEEGLPTATATATVGAGEGGWEPLPAGYRPVLALALSPEGGRLAVGRGDRLVLYDVASTNGPLPRSVRAHADLVRAVAWSPDGRRVASGGSGEVTVWEAASLEPVWTVKDSLAGRVTAVRFTPHGGAVIAAVGDPGREGWVHVVAADDGGTLAAWTAHADTVNDLAISPDGGLLATGGGDKLVKTWELLTRREVARFEGHVGAVTGVAFGRHAAEMVTVGADRQVKLWDVTTGEAVVTMGGRRHASTAVAWSGDGSRVVVVDADGGLQALTEFKRHTGAQSSATAKERRWGRWPGALHAVAISADGQAAYAGGEDGVVRVVRGEGKQVTDLEPEAIAASEGDVEGAEGGEREGAAGPPSFVGDVLPRLAKAGCSAGSCHAKAEGQNGFHLSVFSYDPEADFAELVREGRGRRVSPAAPENSLFLLKATAAVEHGGGRRLEPDSEAYRSLVDWVRGGMVFRRPGEASLVGIEVEPRQGSYRPGEVWSLAVRARYSDGSERDVTDWAEYSSNDKEIADVDARGRVRVGSLSGEGVVVARFMGWVEVSRVTVPAENRLPPERYAALPAYNFVDRLAYERFQELGLFPADLCSDAEFLRRASLDTLGVLPTAAEVREFLAAAAAAGGDSRAVRSAWVDRLLARPEFGDYWANRWADLLRPNPDRVGVKSVYLLDQWLRATFRENQPYDRFVRSILLAEGSNHREGPIVIYRDRREPAELTTLFSQVFLGVRMECAKCHHHPNEKWSQEDFYRFAAYFGPLRQKGAGLSPPISAGTETFFVSAGGTVTHPVTGAVMEPRPLGGGEAPSAAEADPRRALADWLTAPGNPFFARAAVNRVWAAFFGRGFVEPVDDFRVSNPAAHETLLAALAEDFAAHGYDFKHLMRTLLNSRLYQLSSTPNAHNAGDTRHFSRSYRRRLPAEVLLDAVLEVTGVGEEFPGCPPGTRAVQAWSYKVPSAFLDTFGRPNSSSDCPCERDLRPSLGQALHLMNSPQLQEKLASPRGRVRTLVESGRSPEAIVTELYLAVVGRTPTAEELATAAAAFAAEGATRQTAAEDVLWALLNSAEFVFNH